MSDEATTQSPTQTEVADDSNQAIPSELQAPALSEQAPAAEQIEDVIVAETIARLKTNVETLIFDRGLPRTQWRQAYESLLSQNPSILDYKSLFDNVMNRAEGVNDRINNFWRRFVISSNDVQSQNDEVLIGLEEADPEESKAIFHAAYGFEPHGDVQAIKGAVTLRFMVEDEDFRILNSQLDNEEISAGGHATIHPHLEVPIIVIRRQIDSSQMFPALVHELEHAKYSIVGHGPFSPMIIQGTEALHVPTNEMHRRWGKWLKTDTPINQDVRNEVLAYASYLTLLPQELPEYPNGSADEYIDMYLDFVRTTLTDKDGDYYPKYEGREADGINHHEQYTRSVERGLSAFRKLFDRYRKTGMTIAEASRMTINVVGQFPLSKWPAVSFLIDMKRFKPNTSEETKD